MKIIKLIMIGLIVLITFIVPTFFLIATQIKYDVFKDGREITFVMFVTEMYFVAGTILLVRTATMEFSKWFDNELKNKK